jgi:hypothetical protein
MDFVSHPSNNLLLGAPSDWDQSKTSCGALPATRMEVDGNPVIVSFWKPTADELQQLQAGGTVALWVYGTSHPVVAVGVEPAAVEEPRGTSPQQPAAR